jgi:hypothetical protein
VKESVPAEIFANMNNLDDCFKNSQIESRAWKPIQLIIDILMHLLSS